MVGDPENIAYTKRNLAFWQRWVDRVGTDAVPQLDHERYNLFKAAELGLRLPATAGQAARLIADLFQLISRRSYWQNGILLIDGALHSAELSINQQITLHNQAGRLHHLLQQHVAAIAHHTYSLSLAKTDALVSEQLITHTHLSNAHHGAQQYALAYQHATFAQQLAQQQTEQSPYTQAIIYNCLGLAALARGAYPDAIDHFQQAADAFCLLQDIVQQATALTNLGVSYERAGQLQAAHTIYLELDALLAPTDLPLAKIRVWINLGTHALKLGAYDIALTWFYKADTPFLWKSSDYQQQAFVAHNLGYTFHQLNRPEEAVVQLQRAEAIWRATENKLNLGNTLLDLGNAYAAAQQLPHALNTLTQAVQLLSLFPDNSWAQSLADQAANHLEALKHRLDDTTDISDLED